MTSKFRRTFSRALLGASVVMTGRAFSLQSLNEQIGRTQAEVCILSYIPERLWEGLLHGTVVDDVISEALFAATREAGAGGTIIIPPGIYRTDRGLDLRGFTGRILCAGTIKAREGVTLRSLVDLSRASNFEWHGGILDFSQTAGTNSDSSNRCDQGFYLRDARDGKIHGVEFRNVRVGKIIYIDGTSSVSPKADDGSKRISVWDCSCIAFSPSEVDVGVAVYIRSDFFVGAGDGIYMPASNGLRREDYVLDLRVACKPSTTDIEFKRNRFENFDGFRLFNVARITCIDQRLLGFYTRGYSLSPSCEDVVVKGGVVSGNAAHINVNYGCIRCSFSDMVAEGEYRSIGQRHCLRAGFGSRNIEFKNISGFGCDVRHVFIEGARDVVFDRVRLKSWQGGMTSVAVSVSGGGADSGIRWVTTGVRFLSCWFEANYCLKADDHADMGAIQDGGVVFDDACLFKYAKGIWNGGEFPKQLVHGIAVAR